MIDGKRSVGATAIFRDIEEAATGLSTIGIVRDQNGIPVLTSHGVFMFSPKPDLSYSFIYGVCAMYLFLHEKRAELLGEDEEMAVFSAALDSIAYPENAAPQPKIPDKDEVMHFLSSGHIKNIP